MIRLQILAVFSIIISDINAANIIVVFPIAAKSHAQLNDVIVRELINAGHDVTYVTSMPPSQSFPNVTVVDFRFGVEEKPASVSLSMITQPWYRFKKSTLDQLEEKFCYSSNMRKTLDHLKMLKKEFDLLVISAAMFVDCFMPIAAEFDIPIIGAITTRSSEYADRLMGNIRNPATTLTDFIDFYDIHTFWYRLINSFNQLVQFILFNSYDSLKDPRFGKNFPQFDENRKSKLSLVFCNNHLSMLPRPLGPNFIDIGGLHISPEPSALPQQIQTFIEGGNKGVILFSLGSLTESDELRSQINLLKVFAKLPERVIWKTSEIFPNLPENVLTLKWLPQRDILAHKNVKAFITHCGLFGTEEAIFEGKPLVMIPLHSDQSGNAILMHEKGVGIYLELQTLTEDKLFAAVRNVIDDNKYRENMQNLSVLFKDRPLTPQKTLIYWTEYVIRHKGASHLQTVAADVPFYQYFVLDILIFVLISAISLPVFFITVKKSVKVFKQIRTRRKQRKQ